MDQCVNTIMLNKHLDEMEANERAVELCYKELDEAIREDFKEIEMRFKAICKSNGVDDIDLFEFLREL